MVRMVFPLYLCGAASKANMPTLIGSEDFLTAPQPLLCVAARRHTTNTMMALRNVQDDDARFVMAQAADHFAIRAAAEDNRAVGRAGNGHGLFESRRDGEHADQHANDAGDADNRGRDRAKTLRQAQQPELRDGHDL